MEVAHGTTTRGDQMGRATNKAELLDAAATDYGKLIRLIDSMPEAQQHAGFIFPVEGRREAHWVRDKNLRDVLVHLHEWHHLLLTWIETNTAGVVRPFLPEPYTWKTYGQMNQEFWSRHQQTSLSEARELVAASHARVLDLIETFSDQELFTKGYYPWAGTTHLGSYCISATSSHYEWALKKLRLHKKTSQLSG